MASYAGDFNPVGGYKIIHSFLHPEEGYEAAQKQAQQGWNQAQGFEKPFYQQGLDQYAGLNQAGQHLLDPQELQDKWSSGYETSPYAQRMLQNNMQQGQEAASSMGLMGSSGAMQNIQQGAGDIMQKDRQQYMDDLMNKYMQGIGLGQNLYGVGAQMGGQLGSQALSQGNYMGDLAYGRQAAPGRLFENVAKTAIGAATGGGGMGSNQFNQGVPQYMQNAIYQ